MKRLQSSLTTDMSVFQKGEEWVRCTESGWEPKQDIRCEPAECPVIPSYSHATKASNLPGAGGSLRSYGSIVQYACDEGYENQEAGVIVCGPDGKWLGKGAECRIPDCGPPPSVPHARKEQDPTKSVVRYSCEKGYSLLGKSEVFCRHGQWEPAS